MKVSEQIAIMKAYEDGKTIEQKRYDGTEWESIKYMNNHPFNFFYYEYRIKPEDKYRPYESVDEAFNDAKKHGFWIRNKDEGELFFICNIYNTKDGNTCICDFWADELLDKFVWLDDGSPCGVKINLNL